MVNLIHKGEGMLSKRATNLLSYCKNNGLQKSLVFVHFKLRSCIARNNLGWLIFYQMNPVVKTDKSNRFSDSVEKVWSDLQKTQYLSLKEYKVDVGKFEEYIKATKMYYQNYYEGGLTGWKEHKKEKLLQHFLSFELLGINSDDVFIDVASNTSPVKDIVKDKYKIPSYKMDLAFEPGIHGESIGCDASDTGLADNFVSKMTLHCSFEHFAYGSDIGFIKESARILKVGGKVLIAPFYLIDKYCIFQDPTLECSLSIKDKEGAQIRYVRNLKVSYARFYSLDSFKERILSNCNNLQPTLYKINLDGLNKDGCYCHYILLLEKKTN